MIGRLALVGLTVAALAQPWRADAASGTSVLRVRETATASVLPPARPDALASAEAGAALRPTAEVGGAPTATPAPDPAAGGRTAAGTSFTEVTPVPGQAIVAVLPPSRPEAVSDVGPVGQAASEPAGAETAPSAAAPSLPRLVGVMPPARPRSLSASDRTATAEPEPAALADLPPAPAPTPVPTAPWSLFSFSFPRPAEDPAPSLIPSAVGRSAALDALIARHAQLNGVPVDLVHRIVVRESRYNPRAVGRGGALGLMQIKHGTARALGYEGAPSGLLEADTNLTYAVKYLAGAYRTAQGDYGRAVSYYARGYYYAAKRQRYAGGEKRQERMGLRREAEARVETAGQ